MLAEHTSSNLSCLECPGQGRWKWQTVLLSLCSGSLALLRMPAATVVQLVPSGGVRNIICSEDGVGTILGKMPPLTPEVHEVRCSEQQLPSRHSSTCRVGNTSGYKLWGLPFQQ